MKPPIPEVPPPAPLTMWDYVLLGQPLAWLAANGLVWVLGRLGVL